MKILTFKQTLTRSYANVRLIAEKICKNDTHIKIKKKKTQQRKKAKVEERTINQAETAK